ncbi:MAG: UDP-galactopyranose mutase [bacterium]
MTKSIKSSKADYLIVGTGFAGATFARCAADAGYTALVIDKREHIAGNSFSYADKETGIEIHKYGPHIFHTNSKDIWDFINRFTTFNNYTHRVKAVFNNSIYGLPINLHTINQFFHKTFNPKEAQAFIEKIRIDKKEINNFEDFIVSSLGEELYIAFFRDYTIKQWGKDPKEISVSTAKRLPIRFYYDDNYFNDIYQGIPTEGYTQIFNRMLDHPNIKVKLNTSFDEYKTTWKDNYKKLVFTGSIDEYFNYEFGCLPYRTVRFREIRDTDIIGTAQLNFTDKSEKFTRISEHKWFTPYKIFSQSVAFEEYSDFTDSKNEPYYPIRDVQSEILFNKYNNLTKKEKDVIFIGRLAEFKYYDMHQVIGSAIAKFRALEK